MNEPTLVVLTLGEDCGKSGEIRTRNLADVLDKLKLQRGEALQISRLEQSDAGSIRLVFARGAYAVADLTIPLP